ncbi:hypothetical protein M1446_01225 [Candidatus Dependentiae bacterium]|nr:hypothetical protein [Candidatus Dependentiae bacterium]
MLKKLLLILSILGINYLSAILLNNGTYVARQEVDDIYNKLVDLNKEEDKNKVMLLVDLSNACKKYNRKLDKKNFIFDFSKESSHFDKRFEHAVFLELCDKDGNINDHTANIIMCSIECSLKTTRSGLISLNVKSPISVWHYLNFDFLDEDITH